MVLLLITFMLSGGGDYMIGWPKGGDLSGYDNGQSYRLSLDFSFLPRHKIGCAFHPTEFDSGAYSYKALTYDLYYGFDLTSTFFSGGPKVYLLAGGCYHPWRLEYQGEVLELPTGKVEFKDWGYFGGLELSYAPIRFLDLRVGATYYYLMSEHMDRLGFDDHDEKYIIGFGGLRFRI